MSAEVARASVLTFVFTLMDKPTKAKIEEYFRRGILKSDMNRISHIMSRSTDSKGKLVAGEAGARLKQRQLERQQYYERNK